MIGPLDLWRWTSRVLPPPPATADRVPRRAALVPPGGVAHVAIPPAPAAVATARAPASLVE